MDASNARDPVLVVAHRKTAKVGGPVTADIHPAGRGGRRGLTLGARQYCARKGKFGPGAHVLLSVNKALPRKTKKGTSGKVVLQWATKYRRVGRGPGMYPSLRDGASVSTIHNFSRLTAYRVLNPIVAVRLLFFSFCAGLRQWDRRRSRR